MVDYWWNVRYVMDVTPVSRIFSSPHTTLLVLLISAIAFSAYYIKARGVKKFFKAFFLVWFACTVITSLFTLLSLLGLTPVHPYPGTKLVINMFTFSFAATLLNLSNVFGLLELIISVTPSFLIASGVTTQAGLEISSFILSVILIVAGIVIFAFC